MQVWTQPRQRLLTAHEQQQRLEVERAERPRLEGVLLAARTLADRVNNKLSLTVGWTELVAQDPALPPHLLDRVLEAQRGAREAAEVVAQMLGVTHIHEREWHGYIGSTIDLDRSTS